MIKIYHNPRCTKSRQGLALLEALSLSFKVIPYLKDPITAIELKEMIAILDIEPIELVRKNETIWKEQFKEKNLSDEEIIEAMIEYPKLIERPIVINKNKGVVGRPAELIKSIL